MTMFANTVRACHPAGAVHARRASRALLVALALSALVGCSPVIENRGHMPDVDALAALAIGTSTRNDVATEFGSPSTSGTFNENVWYYISEKTRTVAFFKPMVLERHIVAIVYDDRGRIENIVTYTKADGKEVQIVSRVTPTAGNEITILQQLFGNVGRFSREGEGDN